MEYIDPVTLNEGFGNPNDSRMMIEAVIDGDTRGNNSPLSIVPTVNASSTSDSAPIPWWLLALTVFVLFAFSKDLE